MNKKAQMEIMGLAIVMILIALALFFSLKFAKAPDSEIKEDTIDSKLANNMVNVILKTTLDCKDIDLKELLQDCAEGVNNKDYCAENDRDPCGKVRTITESLLNNVLGVQKKTFFFVVKAGSETKIKIGEENCGKGIGFQKGHTQTYPVPYTSVKEGRIKIIETSLSICR